MRFPLLGALAARAAPQDRAAVALHHPEFRGPQGGQTDGAVFLPDRPRIALWRTHFFPTGTSLHLGAVPADGPETYLWLSRYGEAVGADFAAGRDVRPPFVLAGPDSAAGGALELVVGEAPGGWRAWLAEQRRRFLAQLDLALYQREDLRWLRRCFVNGYLFCYEHDFYDERRGGYRYHDWLARAEQELGGFDQIMLCQGSPRLGVDDRNQHDLHRDVPGGLAALRDFVAEAHRYGSKVVYDYRPWDTCTRQSAYPGDHVAGLEELLRQTGMDGAFIDTGYWVPPGFREAADAVRPGIGFSSEGAPPTKADLEQHLSSWAQRGRDAVDPVLFVDGLKYLLPLHNVQLACRWSRNHHRLLTQALFNGQGFYVWEPHYGSWTVWGPASRAVAKRCGAILRANADAFSGLEWEPLVPTLHPSVYANRWPAGDKVLFTLFVVADVPEGSPVLAMPHRPDARYVDLWSRKELQPEVVAGEARLVLPLALDLPACVGVFPRVLTATPGPAGLEVRLTAPSPDVSLRAELVTAQTAAALPVERTGEGAWRVPLGEAVDLETARVVVEALDGGGHLVDVCSTGGSALPARFAPRDAIDRDGGENLFETARKLLPAAPVPGPGVAEDERTGDEGDGMVRVPGGPYRLVVETCDKPEPFACYHPDENYTVAVELRPFLVDRHPVTNAQFGRFLRRSGYRPADPANFLRHWENGAPAPELADHPVVYVGLDDARAYAAGGEAPPHGGRVAVRRPGWRPAPLALGQRLRAPALQRGGGGHDPGVCLPGRGQPLRLPRPVRQRLGAHRRPVQRRPPLLRDPQGGLVLPHRRPGLRGPPGDLRPALAGAAPRGAALPDRLLPPGRRAAGDAPPALRADGRRPRPQQDDRLPVRRELSRAADSGPPPAVRERPAAGGHQGTGADVARQASARRLSMESGTISRRSVVGLGGGLAGLLGEACAPLPTTSPAPSQTRSYEGVTLQHVVKGSDAAACATCSGRSTASRRQAPRGDGAADPGGRRRVLAEAADPAGRRHAPDSAQQDEYFLAHLIAKGELLELTPYQRQDRGFDLKGLSEAAWRAGHYRGKLYGLPSIVFGPVIQYNKEHFDEAGLPYPPADPRQTGWTWTRLREDARKLTKREGGQVVRAGFAFDARFLSRFSGHLYAYGARVMDRLDTPTRCALDEPRAVGYPAPPRHAPPRPDDPAGGLGRDRERRRPRCRATTGRTSTRARSPCPSS